MKYCIILLLLCSIYGCKQATSVTVHVKETTITTSHLIRYKKEINNLYRFSLKKVNGAYLLYNLSKKGDILVFDLNNGSVRTIPTPFPSPDSYAIKYDYDFCHFVNGNVLYRFDYSTHAVDSLTKLPLTQRDFIISNIYKESLHSFGEYFFVQYGTEGMANNLSEESLLFFNRDTSFRSLRTPKELMGRYIHYTDICIDSLKDDLFYVFATSPQIYKTNFVDGRDSSALVGKEEFIFYDTTRLTDMKYLVDYTFETAYNLALHCIGGYVCVVRRTGKKRGDHKVLYVFTPDLKPALTYTLPHDVDPNFIFSIGERLVFLSSKDKMIYEYEIH
jgi:hypothetical protein